MWMAKNSHETIFLEIKKERLSKSKQQKPLFSHLQISHSLRLQPKMAAAASTSMAATAVLLHRLPATKPAAVFCPLPQRPSLSATPFKLLKESRRSSQHLVKASSSEESSFDTNELFTDLKEKWDAVENKTTVIIYGGGAVVGVWLASTVVGAVNSVPLLPKIMELVGLGYTGWFVYRYLLFKSSRKELASDIEALKKKIAGTE